MTAKKKAENLVNEYRVMLMQTDTDAGEEILCTSIAKECAMILAEERLNELNFTHIGYGKEIMQGYQKTKVKFWQEVKKEIIKL
jgi:hypothetical protein